MNMSYNYTCNLHITILLNIRYQYSSSKLYLCSLSLGEPTGSTPARLGPQFPLGAVKYVSPHKVSTGRAVPGRLPFTLPASAKNLVFQDAASPSNSASSNRVKAVWVN